MGIVLAKRFIRQISQPFDHTQTGVSLWTLEDIEKRQKDDLEEKERAEKEIQGAFGTSFPSVIDGIGNGKDVNPAGMEDVDVEMEFGDDGFDDDVLAGVDLPMS